MTRPRRYDPSAAILWASAFVVAALIMLQAGRLPGNPAHAEMSSIAGGYTLLTAASGSGGDVDPDELLYVIDNRNQVLMVYEIEDSRKNQIIFREGQPLGLMFRAMRK